MRLHFYLLSSDLCYMVFIIKSDLPWIGGQIRSLSRVYPIAVRYIVVFFAGSLYFKLKNVVKALHTYS